jgi:hypothetical protein
MQAKIGLSTAHKKILSTRLGDEFLKNSCIRNKIMCRYEYENQRHLLIYGVRQDRHNFHQDLRLFIKSTINFQEKQEIELAKQQMRLNSLRSTENTREATESTSGTVSAQHVTHQSIVSAPETQNHSNSDWSKMCLEVIKLGRPLFLDNAKALKQLNIFSRQAENSLLTNTHFKSLIEGFTKYAMMRQEQRLTINKIN